MRVTTTKSKKSESFYITKSFKNNAGKSSSVVVRKLGTLNELLKEMVLQGMMLCFGQRNDEKCYRGIKISETKNKCQILELYFKNFYAIPLYLYQSIGTKDLIWHLRY